MTFDRITTDPAVAAGKPCVRDTGIPVARILGWMAGGTTRRELLAAHPALDSADIDAALAFVKQQTRARELPDLEYRGVYLGPPELADFRCPDPVGERLETLIRREKTTGVTPEEKAEIDDYLRLDHLLMMTKALARLRLMAPVG